MCKLIKRSIIMGDKEKNADCVVQGGVQQAVVVAVAIRAQLLKRLLFFRVEKAL